MKETPRLTTLWDKRWVTSQVKLRRKQKHPWTIINYEEWKNGWIGASTTWSALLYETWKSTYIYMKHTKGTFIWNAPMYNLLPWPLRGLWKYLECMHLDQKSENVFNAISYLERCDKYTKHNFNVTSDSNWTKVPKNDSNAIPKKSDGKHKVQSHTKTWEVSFTH